MFGLWLHVQIFYTVAINNIQFMLKSRSDLWVLWAKHSTCARQCGGKVSVWSSNNLVLVFMYLTTTNLTKTTVQFRIKYSEWYRLSISERLGVTFISESVVDQTRRREEFPWIETQERRERKTARGRATAPNLNKTNEYITGLFYLSPNGFTS